MADGNGRPIVGLTVGDPAGVGPEIVIKALQNSESTDVVRSLVYADCAVLEQALNALNVTMSLNEVNTPSEGRYESGCIDFVDCGVLNGPIVYGEVSADGGQAGYTYLNRDMRKWRPSGK